MIRDHAVLSYREVSVRRLGMVTLSRQTMEGLCRTMRGEKLEDPTPRKSPIVYFQKTKFLSTRNSVAANHMSWYNSLTFKILLNLHRFYARK